MTDDQPFITHEGLTYSEREVRAAVEFWNSEGGYVEKLQVDQHEDPIVVERSLGLSYMSIEDIAPTYALTATAARKFAEQAELLDEDGEVHEGDFMVALEHFGGPDAVKRWLNDSPKPRRRFRSTEMPQGSLGTAQARYSRGEPAAGESLAPKFHVIGAQGHKVVKEMEIKALEEFSVHLKPLWDFEAPGGPIGSTSFALPNDWLETLVSLVERADFLVDQWSPRSVVDLKVHAETANELSQVQRELSHLNTSVYGELQEIDSIIRKMKMQVGNWTDITKPVSIEDLAAWFSQLNGLKDRLEKILNVEEKES